MRYCPSCLEEYEEGVPSCSECKQALVSEEELARRPGFNRAGQEDPREFVRAGEAEDPFEADAFTAAVHQAGIPVMARMRHGSMVDAITESVARAWWDVLVPADQAKKAAEVIARRREELAAAQPEAEKAAEEEAAETEGKA